MGSLASGRESLNFAPLRRSPPSEVLFYGNPTPFHLEVLLPGSRLSAVSATPVALRAATRCVASHRVTERANGVVCQVRGSQSDGRRALLLAECGEDAPGMALREEKRGGEGDAGVCSA